MVEVGGAEERKRPMLWKTEKTVHTKKLLAASNAARSMKHEK